MDQLSISGMKNKKVKATSYVKSLEQRFGGKWKLNRSAGQWECDDDIRYVCNVLTGTDFNGDYTGNTCKCMYFNDGRTPKWIG